jgi:hypothetical protein
MEGSRHETQPRPKGTAGVIGRSMRSDNRERPALSVLPILLVLSACGGGGSGSGVQAALSYTVGGTVAGLTSPGLVLANGSDTVAVAVGATNFAFPTRLANGAAYAVSVKTQPPGQPCTVSDGTGTIQSALITNVTVTCPSPWIWMGGSSSINAPGMYGTQGVAAAANVPSARDQAASWTDPAGNFWLFGGEQGLSPGGWLNDLWKYSPSTNLWSWVSGSNTPNVRGVYGAQGVGSVLNIPGSRTGAASWVDSQGNLWLFGGFGYDSTGHAGSLNDLWRYTLNTGNWTWMSGANTFGSTGVTGTQGMAAAGNTPAARQQPVVWKDLAGDLWLFGGHTNFGGINDAAFEDLWKFSPATGLWAWIKGDPTGAYFSPTYGLQGVAAPANDPGGHRGAVGWSDAEGNLWLFGGDAGSNFGLYMYNSLWKFSPATDLWTWVGGSDSVNVPGTYGSEGIPARANAPGSRMYAVTWTDASGQFWLFGGDALPANPDVATYQLNDLWMFSPASGEWAWISGTNTDAIGAPVSGIYGTQGVAAPGNVPPGRHSPASWMDASGDLWLFGGGTNGANGGDLNDLWKFSR